MAAEETLRYVKTDYSSNKDALVQRIRARWPGSWNDFSQASFGSMMLDLIAWSNATTAFLINRVAGEIFPSTWTLRESAARLGSFVGYRLHGPVPATVLCEVNLAAAIDADVTISAGTLVRTADGTPFEVVTDHTIDAGSLAPRSTVIILSTTQSGSNIVPTQVAVINGSENIDLIDTSVDLTAYASVGQKVVLDSSDTTSYTIVQITSAPGAISNNRLVLDQEVAADSGTLDATIFEERIELAQGQTVSEKFISPSSVASGFAVRLGYSPLIDASISVEVNGEDWSLVASPLQSDSTAKIFYLRTTASNVNMVVFGDGQFGQTIPTDATIVATYRTGGGVVGNVAIRSIDTSIVGLVTGSSNPVTVLISNLTAAGDGGRDEETLEDARFNIPAFIRSNDRAVHIDDWQSLAQGYSNPAHGSVAFARAVAKAQNSLLEGNLVTIYAWTTGSNGGLRPLSSAMKSALRDYLLDKAMVGDYVLIADGTDRPVPISLRFKSKDGFDLAEVEQLVESGLASAVNALIPGASLVHSQLLTALSSIAGVDSITMATPTMDLVPATATELFTAPDDDHVYDIDRSFVAVDSDGTNIYSAQLPASPLAPWSFTLYIGSTQVLVLPGTVPGYAMLVSSGVLATTFKDANGVSTAVQSTVNLLTGIATLYIIGSQGSLTAKIVAVKGYNRVRDLNVYVSYTGSITDSKRREIRSAIRSWGDGLDIGQAMYARSVTGVAASTSNIEAVVSAITDVDSVTRVSLDTPTNADSRVVAGESELLRIGTISLNGSLA